MVGFCLVPELDDSSDDVSDKSSEDDEDEESDKLLIYFRVVWTHSCSFACSIVAFQLVDIQELFSAYSYKASITAYFFNSSASYCALLIRSSSHQASS